MTIGVLSTPTSPRMPRSLPRWRGSLMECCPPLAEATPLPPACLLDYASDAFPIHHFTYSAAAQRQVVTAVHITRAPPACHNAHHPLHPLHSFVCPLPACCTQRPLKPCWHCVGCSMLRVLCPPWYWVGFLPVHCVCGRASVHTALACAESGWGEQDGSAGANWR